MSSYFINLEYKKKIIINITRENKKIFNKYILTVIKSQT